MSSTAGASPDEPNHDRDREEETGPDPSETQRRAQARVERETQEFRRELRKKSALGAAFQAGSQSFKEIYELLKENWLD